MPRHAAHALAYILTAVMLAAVTPAGAVVKGTSSSLGYTVRIVGPFYCSGVVIARRAVATAAHCANSGMRIHAGGRSIGIAGISRSALLDDGRPVSVTGDAAILKLVSPLPAGVGVAPVGDGAGDTFIIAGYGTANERYQSAFGTLREATVVAAEPRALADPKRSGSISASACFGDSGGPVMRGGMLVGIITRAAHPSPRIACGDLTRWAAITANGTAKVVAVADDAAAKTTEKTNEKATEKTSVAEPRERKARRHAVRKRAIETAAVMPFNTWYAPKVEARRLSRHKSAQR
jgi:Trypsin